MSTPSDVRTRVEATYNAAVDRFEDPVNSYWDRFGRRTVERLRLASGSGVLDLCYGAGASAPVVADPAGPTGQLTDEQRDRVREASSAYVRASGAAALTTSVVSVTAGKPI